MKATRALAGATAWLSAIWLATSPLSAAAAQPAHAKKPHHAAKSLHAAKPQTLDDFLASDAQPSPAPAVAPNESLPPADLVGPLDGALPWPPLVTPEDAAQPASGVEAADDDAASAAAAEPAAPPPLTSAIVSQVADWISATHDNRGLPYVIIDKVGAEVFVFNRRGVLKGSAPVLVGSAMGDDSTPGVGDREMSKIKPSERTTPAGRFLAGFGPGWGGEKVIWVDYKAAIALHPVVTAHPKERRPQRLASPTPDDNRISYGCINVSAPFYRKVVRPVFARSNAIVYILPDTKPLETVFPALGLWTIARAADLPAADPASVAVADVQPAAPPRATKATRVALKRRAAAEQTAAR